MARFDIHEWRNKYLYNDPYQDTIDTLAEVYIQTNYPKNIILEQQVKEGIINNIKKTFNKLSTKVKDTFKDAIDGVGKKSLTALAKAFKGYEPKSPNEITTLIKIANSKLDFSQINEVSNKIEFIKTIEELSKLSPDSVFKWEGETDSNFTYQGNPHNEFEGAGKGPSGLQKDEYYAILPGIEWENEAGETMNSPDQIVTLKLAKEIENDEASGINKGETILSTLRNFFTKTTGGKAMTFLMLSLGIMSVTGGFSANTVDAMSDFVEAHDVAEDGGFGGVIPDGIEGNVTDDFDSDVNDTVNLTQDVDVTATDADPKMEDLSTADVDLKNLNWGDNVNELTAFDVGEYTLSETEMENAASSLVEKVLEEINNAVEEGKSLENLSITIDYGGSVSNQGDADSNIANDGTNLVEGRTATSLEIAELAQNQIIEIVTNQVGQDFADVSLEITLNEIDTEGGIEDQKIQSAADGINTQSAFQSIDIDLETGDGDTFTMLSYQFAKAPDDERRPEVPPPPPSVTPEPELEPVIGPDNLKDFSSGIREAQITMIFQLIKPEIPIFSYINQIKGKGNENKMLGGETYTQSDWVRLAKSETSNTQKDWSKASDEELAAIGASRYEKGGEIILVPPEGGWPLSIPQEVKDLAKVITNARKSPDTWTKKIGSILGIEFGKRAKAQMLQPGKAGQGQDIVGLSPLQETHLFNAMLFEASIDQFLDKSNIEKNAGKILSFIGSMYASQDDITLGILNPERLSSNLKKQIEDLGFTPITTGREAGVYVFTSPGDTGLHTNQPTDQGTFLHLIKIFTTPEGINEFPKGIENTKFYKDAVKDDWTFINRKDTGNLPKGTKLKTISQKNLDNIKNLDYNKLKKSLNENMKKFINKKNAPLREARNSIAKVLREINKRKNKLTENPDAPHGAGKDAKRDVTAVNKLLSRIIDTRDEYGETLITILQYDVAGKSTAIRNAFRELGSETDENLQNIANQLIKVFGDETDTYQSFTHGDKDYTIDSEETPEETPTDGDDNIDTSTMGDTDIEQGFEDEEI